MVIKEYLNRIGYEGEIKLDIETLKRLHKLHVLSIPFEDLDIHLKNPIKLELELLYEKIILKNRGGFCYELNYLFYSLLKKIGFECEILSSRIYNENGIKGPEFDHMSIIVKLLDNWLIDVGYGDLFIEPLRIIDKYESKEWFKTYRINKMERRKYLLCESKNGNDFTNRYEFDITPRNIEDFYEQCKLKQTSQESYFVINKICTIPTYGGRTTLFNNKLTKTADGLREEFEIESESKFYQILKEEFQIEIMKKIQH